MNNPPTPATAPKRPALPLTGGCSCGAIRYQILTYPLLLYACHCTDCQRQSGTAFAMNMPVSTEALRIMQGELNGWRRRSPSGAGTISWFCGGCGGRIYGSRTSRPKSVIVRAGTLDETTWLTPAFHMFVRSAQSWLRLPETECYEASPPDFSALAKAWQANWSL